MHSASFDLAEAFLAEVDTGKRGYGASTKRLEPWF
jgi:hypothetical protein